MAYTPAWEGLLRLYEVTGEKRFLDAAVLGARMVMTGMWTQPTPADGSATIHPGGLCHGDKTDRLLYKGAVEFRLGWPRQPGDTPERQAPGRRHLSAGSPHSASAKTFQPPGFRYCGHR